MRVCVQYFNWYHNDLGHDANGSAVMRAAYRWSWGAKSTSISGVTPWFSRCAPRTVPKPHTGMPISVNVSGRSAIDTRRCWRAHSSTQAAHRPPPKVSH